jgi:hypothetical protein
MTQEKLHPQSILLAGIPATGKSTFGNWLEQQKGYFHLDFDEEDVVEQRGFKREQQLLWKHGQSEPLHASLLARKQPIVLNWGFAPHFLPLVKQLLMWGFIPVWFTATPAVARVASIRRGGIDIKYFDQYMAGLDEVYEDVMAVFGHSIIRTLRDDGTRMHPFEIYATIFPSR